MTSKTMRILVALDGSPEAESILAAIMPLVRLSRVDLVLLRVAASGAEVQEARAYLEKMEGALALHRIRAESRAEVGAPDEMILAHLKGGGFDFGGMTTHGRRGLSRLLAGSTAESVLRSSPVPLIINRPDARIGDWEKIVVPLDGSSTAEAVLDDLELLAAGSTFHLVHIAEVLVAAAGMEFTYGAVSIPDLKPYLKGLADRMTAKGLNVVTHDRVGLPGPDVVRYAKDLDAGLIAMTTHGRSGLRRVIMGSVAEHILRTSPCAVLVRPLSLAPEDRGRASASARPAERVKE